MKPVLKYLPILLLFFASPALAQHVPVVIKKDTIRKAGRRVVTTHMLITETVTDEDNTPEEMEKFDQYVKKHIKAIPGVHGSVTVRFTNEADGSITHIEVVKSLSKAADKEALRLVRSYPKWQPTRSNGKPESSVLTLPIEFK